MSDDGKSDVQAMHARLVEYGRCFLQGGAGRITGQRCIIDRIQDDYVLPEWSGEQCHDALMLHRLVVRLPIRHRLVLQVFFGERIARKWGELTPETQDEFLRDMTFWPRYPYGVNPRLANYARATSTAPERIQPRDFLPIRDRGIRMLVNAETLVRALEPRLAGVAQNPQAAATGGRAYLTTAMNGVSSDLCG